MTGADTDFPVPVVDYYGEYAFTVKFGIGSLLDETKPLEWKFTLDSVCNEVGFIHYIDDQDILLAYNNDPACEWCKNPIRDAGQVIYDSSI